MHMQHNIWEGGGRGLGSGVETRLSIKGHSELISCFLSLNSLNSETYVEGCKSNKHAQENTACVLLIINS